MNVALQFSHVHYTYPNGHHALHDICLSIECGQCVAVVGANSAGKSTLLLQANGCLLPQQGEVLVYGERVHAGNLPHIRAQVGMVFQNADDQLFMPSIEEDVAFGPQNMGLDTAEIEARVHEALYAVGGEHLRHRQPQHLSGGEKRAAAIATVLSMRPEIVLLDEPTANLDPLARRRFIRLLEALPHTRLVATHDIAMVLDVATQVVVLHAGRIVAVGEPEYILRHHDMAQWGLEAVL